MVLDGVDVIALAFNVFNFLRLASYFPQIVAVARDRQLRQSRSLAGRSGSGPMPAPASMPGSSWPMPISHSSMCSMRRVVWPCCCSRSTSAR